ncbi:uncharacterized protein LOC108153349 [Drosophila miranda]|nr:uncharacterized protein LOC6598287 [Drosophila persimilis]XP_017138805.2 uncharacterized protein LOC108153349 [Drosophila miranda]
MQMTVSASTHIKNPTKVQTINRKLVASPSFQSRFHIPKMRTSAVSIFFGSSAVLLLVMLLPSTVEAASEPVCTYRNSEDETIFLKYLPLLKRGQDYVDFGQDGKCLKRAICTDTFKILVEDCVQHKINCANKDRFTGVFPACCLKCP